MNINFTKPKNKHYNPKHISHLYSYYWLIDLLRIMVLMLISSNISFAKETGNEIDNLDLQSVNDSIYNKSEITVDTLTSRSYSANTAYNRFIIPSTFISYGVLTRIYTPLKLLDFSTHEKVSKHVKRTITIDDYLQYTPVVALYSLDLAGIKAVHNFKERTIITSSSFFIMTAIVHTLKHTTKIPRPNGSGRNSFPSGHTSTAFTGAHILFREYQGVSPLIGVSAYTVAAVTGTLRIINKKHWLSDVVTGAGVGILSAEIGYSLLPIICKAKTSSHISVIPVIYTHGSGIEINYSF